MLLPPWTRTTDAPKNPDILSGYLTEALAFTAEARGHRAFAALVRRQGIQDLFHVICQHTWHATRDWDVETFCFWAAFPAVEKDKELLDLFDTICCMTPLGDAEDEEEADAYWPDLVATVRGLCGASAN